MISKLSLCLVVAIALRPSQCAPFEVGSIFATSDDYGEPPVDEIVEECNVYKSLSVQQANIYDTCWQSTFYGYWPGYEDAYYKCHEQGFGRRDFDSRTWRKLKRAFCNWEFDDDLQRKMQTAQECLEAWKDRNPAANPPRDMKRHRRANSQRFKACLLESGKFSRSLANNLKQIQL